ELSPEELLEKRIAREWRTRLHLTRGIDIHNSRCGFPHERSEGQLHIGAAERYLLLSRILRHGGRRSQSDGCQHKTQYTQTSPLHAHTPLFKLAATSTKGCRTRCPNVIN